VQKLHFLLFFLLIPFTLLAQKRTKITLVNSQHSTVDLKSNISYLRKPVFQQDNAILRCDSAVFFEARNVFEAYNNVHINQADTVNIYSDRLTYDGNTKMAHLSSNVRLLDRTSVLTTNILDYNMNTKVGTYVQGGKIVSKGAKAENDVTVTSKNGYYFANSRDAYFRYDVVVVSPEVRILSDTMRYNTLNSWTYFYGPTNIKGKDDNLYTENGAYNTKSEYAYFGRKNLYTSGSKSLKGDSLYYDGIAGYGKAVRNIVFSDTVDRTVLYGQLGYYYKADERALVTKNPYVGMGKDSVKVNDVLRPDTLWVGADTLETQMVLRQTLKLIPRPVIKKDNEIGSDAPENGEDPKAARKKRNAEAQEAASGKAAGRKEEEGSAEAGGQGAGGKAEEAGAAAGEKAGAVSKATNTADSLSKVALSKVPQGKVPQGKAPKLKGKAAKAAAKAAAAAKKLDAANPDLKNAVLAGNIGLDSLKKIAGADSTGVILNAAADSLKKVAATGNGLSKAAADSLKKVVAAGNGVSKAAADSLKKVASGITANANAKASATNAANSISKATSGAIKAAAGTAKSTNNPASKTTTAASSTGIASAANGGKSAAAKDTTKNKAAAKPPVILDPTDTVKVRAIKAYHNVRVYKSNLQAKSDSLFYNSADSTLRWFKNPIMWGEGSQQTGDTIYLQMKNSKLSSVQVLQSAFSVNVEKDSAHFNQVKGKVMTGFFREGKIQSLYVDGNAESIYFTKDDNNVYKEMNQTVSSRLKITFKDDEIADLVTIKEAESAITPLSKLDEDVFLTGFMWKPELRPLSKRDITNPKARKATPSKKPVGPKIEANANAEGAEKDNKDPDAQPSDERKSDAKNPKGTSAKGTTATGKSTNAAASEAEKATSGDGDVKRTDTKGKAGSAAKSAAGVAKSSVQDTLPADKTAVSGTPAAKPAAKPTSTTTKPVTPAVKPAATTRKPTTTAEKPTTTAKPANTSTGNSKSSELDTLKKKPVQ
jgi:lipopolysaccharide export system protein LptA